MLGERMPAPARRGGVLISFVGLLLVFPLLDTEVAAHPDALFAALMAIAVAIVVSLRRAAHRGFLAITVGGSALLATAIAITARGEGSDVLLVAGIVLASTALAAVVTRKTALAVLAAFGCGLLLLDPRGERADVIAGLTIATLWAAALCITFARAPERTREPSLRYRLRRRITRRHLDKAVDWIRFRVDTFPRSVGWLAWFKLPELHSAVYQELPWINLRAGRRAESTITRWGRMRPVVESCGARSALDVGANVGWFAFALAELGIPTIAVERGTRFVRIGLYARKRSPVADDVSFLVMDVTPRNADLVPAADVVILLSIWHHFVREYGFAGATTVLESLWEKTGKVLFFETGEAEMPADWVSPRWRRRRLNG
jgi:hypothetical protein